MEKTRLICEIASSHNGDIELAKALIKSAADNGADIVKFQDWRASNVPDNDLDKKRYEAYEFKDSWYPVLIDYCSAYNVEFLTSCFNKDRVEFLAELGLKKIKIASISATNNDLLVFAGAHFDELIVSTGMMNDEEVTELIDVLQTNAKRFTIMHCVAEYPLRIENANLGRIDKLKECVGEYGSVGYSDHSLGLAPAVVAMSKGVKYLEKHFTLSRLLPQIPHQMYEGGDLITTHQVAIEPLELKQLSEWRDSIELTHKENKNDVEDKIKKRYSNRYGT